MKIEVKTHADRPLTALHRRTGVRVTVTHWIVKDEDKSGESEITHAVMVTPGGVQLPPMGYEEFCAMYKVRI